MAKALVFQTSLSWVRLPSSALMPLKDKLARQAHTAKYKREVWYPKNKARVIAKAAKRNKESGRWIFELKAGLKCMKCGESHPACLDFHHRDPLGKDISVAGLRGYSMTRILGEMAKCDVLCSNCHRKEHARLRSVANGRHSVSKTLDPGSNPGTPVSDPVE